MRSTEVARCAGGSRSGDRSGAHGTETSCGVLGTPHDPRRPPARRRIPAHRCPLSPRHHAPGDRRLGAVGADAGAGARTDRRHRHTDRAARFRIREPHCFGYRGVLRAQRFEHGRIGAQHIAPVRTVVHQHLEQPREQRAGQRRSAGTRHDIDAGADRRQAADPRERRRRRRPQHHPLVADRERRDHHRRRIGRVWIRRAGRRGQLQAQARFRRRRDRRHVGANRSRRRHTVRGWLDRRHGLRRRPRLGRRVRGLCRSRTRYLRRPGLFEVCNALRRAGAWHAGAGPVVPAVRLHFNRGGPYVL